MNVSSEEEEVIKVRVGSDGKMKSVESEEDQIDDFINSNADL